MGIETKKNRALFFSALLAVFLAEVAGHAQPPQRGTGQKKSNAGMASSPNSLGMKMVLIKPGSFQMGATVSQFQLGKRTDLSKDAPYYDETPVHDVQITYPFLISETEVTI